LADPRFKNIEFKVGIFVLAAAVTIIFAIVFIGINKKIFVQKIRVYVKSHTGEGLKKGMPVLFSGFEIAKVGSVELIDASDVEIIIDIPKDYINWIKVDSKVKLVSQGFIGSTALVFENGKGEPVVEGSRFILIREKGLEEIIEKSKPVMDDIKLILENVKTITEKLAQIDGPFDNLMKGLGAIGTDLTNKEGSMGYLLRSDYLKDETKLLLSDIKKLTKNLNELTTLGVEIADNVSAKVSDVDINEINRLITNSSSLIENIDKSLNELEPTISHINKISEEAAQASDNLTLLRQEADYILKNANDLLLNLKNKWPFNAGKEIENKNLKVP
jgi:phospholipid/cholesterol/gamma-HCH transport system substrate-binding protein